MTSSTNGMLSPADSATSSTAGGLQRGGSLPMSRKYPLKPGSQKEIALINYIDDRILRITRRYAKKFSNSTSDADDTKGYVTFDEVLRDIDAVFQVVWISGTPTLQIPYLLSLAGLFCSYMPAFPFTPSIFGLVKKLDEAFVHLLKSSPAYLTNSPYQVSTTDKVRIKSLAEETRVFAVEVASESGTSLELENSESDEGEYTNADQVIQEHEEDISLSKIYRRTIEILGDSIVATPAHR